MNNKVIISLALTAFTCMPLFGMDKMTEQAKKALAYGQELYTNYSIPITPKTVLIGAGIAGTGYIIYSGYHGYYNYQAKMLELQKAFLEEKRKKTEVLKKGLSILQLNDEPSIFKPNASQAMNTTSTATAVQRPQTISTASSSSSSSSSRASIVSIKPRELPNVGNSCYMNAMLQCLYALEPFRELLIPHHIFLQTEKPVFVHPFLIHLQRIFEAFATWNTLDRTQKEELLCPLYQWIQASINKLDLELLNLDPKEVARIKCDWDCTQEDSSEVFQKCIDFFEIEQFLRQTKVSDLSTFLRQRSERKITSPLDRIFDLKQLAGIWHNRNLPEKDPEAVHTLLCELPQETSQQLSLYDLLGETKPLPEDLEMEKSDLPRNARREDCVIKRKLTASSDILAIKLLRFYINPTTGVQEVIKYPVIMPLQIDILGYELVSFTNTGGINDGHYVAYVKTENGWLQCSDRTITPITTKGVESAASRGYIFFYKRRTR